jgi:hypothetical protein
VLLRHERFTMPSFHVVTAESLAMAQEMADELLDNSPDYFSVEVWEGAQQLHLKKSAAALNRAGN